ncbi:hypothetical protein RclHR1_06340004 [Rhizophagus clarus]|uniref:Uncharacterized protein n=1 Tax=Rhizophagus clarus TaxID=94130 RepID=A0A2Z6RRB9_9GLOM|nr:hypothetical protein RclHR1_06340004 [Rhizophagus clarus]
MKDKNELNDIIPSEELNITNPEIIQEVIDTMGLDICRSTRDISCYLILQLQKFQILKSSDSIIHLRISGDAPLQTTFALDAIVQRINMEIWKKIDTLPSRAKLIRKLWDEFYELYCALRNKNTNPIQLKQQSLKWLSLFFTPSQGNPSNLRTYVRGLYMPNQVTPYIHALAYHGWELLEKHRRWVSRPSPALLLKKRITIKSLLFFARHLKMVVIY